MFNTIVTLVKSLKMVNPYLSRHKLKLVTSSFLDLVQAACNIAPPILAGQFYRYKVKSDQDSGQETNLFSELQVLYLAVAAFGLSWTAARIMPVLRKRLLDPIRTESETGISVDILKKCYGLELDAHLSTQTGDFAQLLWKNYYTMGKLIPEFFGQVNPMVVETVSATVALSYFHGYSGGLVSAIFLGYTLLTMLKVAQLEAPQDRLFKVSNTSYGELLSAINRYELAHDCGNVPQELTVMRENLTKDLESEFNRFYRLQGYGTAVQVIFGGLSLSGVLLFSIYLHALNLIDMVDFAVLTYYLTQYITSLSDYSLVMDDLYRALVDFDKTIEFLNKKSPIEDAPDAKPLALSHSPEIEFKNVSFKYGEERSLHKISFKIYPGHKVAVVGESGSGKSTLIQLLMRFYNYQDGDIFINRQSIKKFKSSSVREFMAVVKQNPPLFNTSIAENIKYGHPNVSEEELQMAVTLASLQKLNSSSEGLERLVGEKGTKLSGGERQRVAIARALLKRPLILLLDEPTSALDNQSEREIMEVLDQVSAMATTLIVTHKLFTVLNADWIIYMVDGEIAEQGTVKDLLNNKEGHFYNQLKVECLKSGISIDSIKITDEDKPRIKNRDLISHGSEFSLWSKRPTLNENKDEDTEEAFSINRNTESSSLLGNQRPSRFCRII